MQKPDPTEAALAALRALREQGNQDSIRLELPVFLKDVSSAVVARASEMAGNLREIALAPSLVEAFRRILPIAPKRDLGCSALTNIATALVQMEAETAEIFATGIKYVQWEPTWGGRIDTAVALRAICAMGLVSTGDPDALLACCDLLNDQAREARNGALRALGASGRAEAELLLRFKARLGDEEIEVTGEAFRALLHLGPRERSVPYVAEFLRNSNDEIAESAAIALGESRLPQAMQPLREAFLSTDSTSRKGAILWALALSRDDAAAEFCFEQLQSGTSAIAVHALGALTLYQHDAGLRARVQTVIDFRKDRDWDAIWQEKRDRTNF